MGSTGRTFTFQGAGVRKKKKEIGTIKKLDMRINKLSILADPPTYSIYEVDIDNPSDEYFQFTIFGFPTFVFCINYNEVECLRGAKDLEKFLSLRPNYLWRIPR